MKLSQKRKYSTKQIHIWNYNQGKEEQEMKYKFSIRNSI